MGDSIQVLAPEGARLCQSGVIADPIATPFGTLQDPQGAAPHAGITGAGAEPLRAATTAPTPVASATPPTLWVMKQVPRWLVWRYVPVLDDKPKKKPFYANGRGRGDTDTAEDTAQLASYDQACAALRDGSYDGLGFALGFDGYAYWQGIDLDNVREKELGSFAKEMPGYIELSPSETGCHAIGYGRAFHSLSNNGSGIEAYSSKRYFTFTENVQDDCPIRCIADYVEQVLAPVHELRKKKSSHGGRWNSNITLADIPNAPQVKTDAEVWRSIESAANFETIKALCNKPAQRGNNELDASLMQHLVFHSPNNEQVLRLFKTCPIAQREKIMVRSDYVLNTLLGARNIRNAERENALVNASALAEKLADNPAFQAQLALHERMRIADQKAAARFAAKSTRP